MHVKKGANSALLKKKSLFFVCEISATVNFSFYIFI